MYKKASKIIISTAVALSCLTPAYALDVNPWSSGGDRFNNTGGMNFDNGSGTQADPRLIQSNTNPNEINKVLWKDFDVFSGEYVNFDFQSTGQTILNYVSPYCGSISLIQGVLTSSGNAGKVMLINPNGLYFDGASIENMSSFFFSDLLIDYYDLDPTDTDIQFYQKSKRCCTRGVEFLDTTIQNVDNLTGLVTGMRVNDSTLTANNSINLLSAGDTLYTLADDSFSDVHGNEIKPICIKYYTEPRTTNSFAQIFIGENATLEVLEGNIDIKNIVGQDEWSSSIEIQGLVKANASIEGNGNIYLLSSDTFKGDEEIVEIEEPEAVETANADFLRAAKGEEETETLCSVDFKEKCPHDAVNFINIIGTVQTSADCPITPEIKLEADEIRTRVYETQEICCCPHRLPCRPEYEVSQGTIIDNKAEGVSQYVILSDPLQEFIVEEVTPDAVENIIFNTPFNSEEGPFDTLVHEYTDCVPPPPTTIPSDGSDDTAAVAIPTGLAAAGLIGAFTTPFRGFTGFATGIDSTPAYYQAEFAPGCHQPILGGAAPITGPGDFANGQKLYGVYDRNGKLIYLRKSPPRSTIAR